MPIDYKKYPPHWHTFSRQIRQERDKNVCVCSGQCGNDHHVWGIPGGFCHAPNGVWIVRDPVEPWIWWPEDDCPFTVDDTDRGIVKRVKVVLTVSHQCTCAPLCAIADHCISLCQRCHLRCDTPLHSRHAAETRRRAREALGQLTLWEG